MFGYIAPLKSELKMGEFEVYTAYYCAICHAVKRRYGEVPRLLLSYDAVFVALLAEGLSGEPKEPNFTTFRCFNNPLKKRNEAAPSVAIDYAADVMALLGWLSLKDGKEDKDAGNLFKGAATAAGEAALRGTGMKAAERLGEKAWVCRMCSEEQKVIEAKKTASLDRAADPTGQIMEILMDFPFVPKFSKELRELGYHLGRFIYIIDAVYDLEKDRKSGAYNPLLICPETPEALKTAVLLDLARVCEILGGLDLVNHKSIIDNIVYLGLRAKLDEVLGKTRSNQENKGQKDKWQEDMWKEDNS